jgi:hypothetical protein
MTKIFGQEVETLQNQFIAIILNIYSWLLSLLPFSLGKSRAAAVVDAGRCVSIGGPGGLDVLQVQRIPGPAGAVRATIGYNLPGMKSPFVAIDDASKLPRDLVLVNNSYFSVNYADVCIRWG